MLPARDDLNLPNAYTRSFPRAQAERIACKVTLLTFKAVTADQRDYHNIKYSCAQSPGSLFRSSGRVNVQ